MGYQVKNICFLTKQQANNYYLSQIIPVISDNNLVMPAYHNNRWYLAGKEINVEYPPCDYLQNMRDGMEFGFLFLSPVVLAFGFRFLYSFIKKWHDEI